MMQQSRFIIVRGDLQNVPTTVITGTLLLGRLRECELLLNHPAVSRVQAGIRRMGVDYHLFSLRQLNPVKLNGRPVIENEVLAAGDVIEAGPFIMMIDHSEDALLIKVSLPPGRVVHTADVSSSTLITRELEALNTEVSHEKKPVLRARPLPGTRRLDVYWDQRIRDAGKLGRPGPLFPKREQQQGKSHFEWKATSDLTSSTSVSFLIWSVILAGVLLIIWAYFHVSG